MVQELPEDEEDTPCSQVLHSNFEAGFTQAAKIAKHKKKKGASKATKLPQIKRHYEEDLSLNAALYLEQHSRTPTMSPGPEKTRLSQ